MAKNEVETNGQQRKSRKDMLLTRKQQQQSRQIRIVVLSIIGIIAFVLIAGIFVEYVVIRQQPVAVVNGDEISLDNWQQQVRFERAELIDNVESLSDLLGNDVAQVQQFAAQQINILAPSPQSETAMGNIALQQMIDDLLIRQEAEKRGITISATDVQKSIEEQYNFYNGELPPTPESVGPEPTPTVTPIPAEGAEVVEPAPTLEPEPTATPVSDEGFLELYAVDIARLRDAGVNEDVYRAAVMAGLYREAFQELLGEEAGIVMEEEQAKILLIDYATEEEALAALGSFNGADDYLAEWNSIRSTPAVTDTDPIAQDAPWLTFEDMSSRVGDVISEAAFAVPVDGISDVLVITDEESGTSQYVIVWVQGREVRPLPESQISNEQSTALNTWLETARISEGVIIRDIWTSRVPSRPALDDQYFRVAPQQSVPVPTTTTDG